MEINVIDLKSMIQSITRRREHTCKTPGAIYHFNLNERNVGVDVEIPFEIELSEEEAIALEDEIHDAMELILEKFWRQSGCKLSSH